MLLVALAFPLALFGLVVALQWVEDRLLPRGASPMPIKRRYLGVRNESADRALAGRPQPTSGPRRLVEHLQRRDVRRRTRPVVARTSRGPGPNRVGWAYPSCCVGSRPSSRSVK